MRADGFQIIAKHGPLKKVIQCWVLLIIVDQLFETSGHQQHVSVNAKNIVPKRLFEDSISVRRRPDAFAVSDVSAIAYPVCHEIASQAPLMSIWIVVDDQNLGLLHDLGMIQGQGLDREIDAVEIVVTSHAYGKPRSHLKVVVLLLYCMAN